jgi:hypothetical protein
MVGDAGPQHFFDIAQLRIIPYRFCRAFLGRELIRQSSPEADHLWGFNPVFLMAFKIRSGVIGKWVSLTPVA